MTNMEKLKLVGAIAILVALIVFVPKAHSQEIIVGVGPNYNACVESCVYNTYANIDMTYECQQYCMANPGVVVVIPNGGYFHRGHFIPRGGYYPRHDHEGREHGRHHAQKESKGASFEIREEVLPINL